MPLAYYALSGLLNFLSSFAIAFFLFAKARSVKPGRLFAFFATSVAFWSLFYFLSLRSQEAKLAEFYFRTCMIGVVCMPSLFAHFVMAFLHRRLSTWFLAVNYVISGLFAAATYTQLFMRGVGQHLVFPYWGIPGTVFPLHLLHFGLIAVYTHYLMFQAIRQSQGVFRNQVLYVFLGTAIGFLSGSTNYFSWYRIPIPPFLNPLISLYVVLVALALTKYRLSFVIALTRGSIFGLVYLLVLGTPFVLATWLRTNLEVWLGSQWWVVPLVTMAVLGTASPFIYFFFQRKAEARLLREQHRYQTMLLNAAKGMTQIHNLQQLLKLLAYLLVRAMKLTHASIFLWDENREQHVLQVQVRPLSKATSPSVECGTHEPLVLWLMQERAPVVRDEISQLTDAKRSRTVSLSRLETRLKQLNAAVVVPSFVNDRLIGFLALGNKRTGTMYSEDDLNMLQTLANQAALAIENAQFYQKEQEHQAELFHAASIADLGTMASSMSHQLNNPFCIIAGTAQNREEYLHRLLKQDNALPESVRNLLQDELELLKSMREEAMEGSNIIATIRGITAAQEEGRPLLLVEAVSVAQPIVQHKVPFKQLDFRQELPETLPRIWGNRAQLAQCIISFIENAWDAIQARQNDHRLPPPPPGYKGLIRLAGSTITEPHPETKKLTQWVVLTISDNGIGLKPEDVRKLFIPFFTTKATAEKAFGSLFVVRRIIEAHGGTVTADSTYGVGTTFKVRLPVLTDEEAERRMTAGRLARNGPVGSR